MGRVLAHVAMRKEAFGRGLDRATPDGRGARRAGLLGGLGWTLLCGIASGALLAGCSKLSEEECNALRGQAFEIINVQCDGCLPHTCNDDTDCIGTTWPGCTKPVNKKNLDKIGALETKFNEGSCKEDEHSCPDAPEVYCKQGLCVFRHRPGEAGKVEQ